MSNRVVLVAFLLLLCCFSAAIGQSSSDSLSVSDTLFVTDLVLCRDVIEREPVDVVESYTADDSQAWVFARIHNEGAMTEITFRWFYEETEYYTLDARVGTSKRWRTYSRVTLQPGAWRVEIVDAEGNLLKEARFHVAS